MLIESLLPQYTDLRDLLHGLLPETGVDVEFDSEVVKIDPWHPSVTLTNGAVIYGDVIIGADGADGITRRVVASDSEKDIAGPYPHFRYVEHIEWNTYQNWMFL